ncbi:hypothetical protein P9Z84_22095 [Bacillus cereus]|nr:hypothetical protein [Bacillus cereus]
MDTQIVTASYIYSINGFENVMQESKLNKNFILSNKAASRNS